MRPGFVQREKWLPGTPYKRTARPSAGGPSLSFWIKREQRRLRDPGGERLDGRGKVRPAPARCFSPRAGQGVLEVARSWSERIGRAGVWTKADLAAALGLSRARVSQVLSVLDAEPDVLKMLIIWEKSGQPVTERAWRLARGRSAAGVLRELARMGWC